MVQSNNEDTELLIFVVVVGSCKNVVDCCFELVRYHFAISFQFIDFSDNHKCLDFDRNKIVYHVRTF